MQGLRRRLIPVSAGCGLGWLALLGLLIAWAQVEPAAAEGMQLRIAWGGGAERLWNATVTLSQGALLRPRPLGIAAGEPGSMWLEPATAADDSLSPGTQRLVVRQSRPQAYDGVDVLVDAPLEARLIVQLKTDEPGPPLEVEVPLAGLLDEFFSQDLDPQGNRLLIRRTPGDKLRVQLPRDHLLFAPGETFRFTLEPHLLPLPAGNKVQIKARLTDARGRQEHWSVQREVQSAPSIAELPLEVTLPEQEGVYDVTITATHSAGWQEAVRQPLRPQQWKKTLAERKIQLVVMQNHALPTVEPPPPLAEVVEINPASPGWWERLGKLPHLPSMRRWWKGPLGNDRMSLRSHPLGSLVELQPSVDEADVSWEAYTLPIKHPGRPHVLEVEYPSNVAQTLGISILEPNAAGVLTPVGLDSGVDCDRHDVAHDGSPRWLVHRLVFWPRTGAPMLLISNRRARAAAVYGKIRVLAGWQRLPKAMAAAAGPGPERLLAAYLDRPLFPENFSANETLDQWSNRSLDDWQTFYEGAVRLADYLEYVGYNALMIVVLDEGSTLYPSEILQPTPRYDTGAFFDTAQDPVRKDVLELLLRVFDRRGLKLIPAIAFSAPLPELEAALRRAGPQSRGVEWVGPDGATWRQTYPARSGLAPYYNTLAPQVQQAMVRVAGEVVGRYAHHPSFAGLAIRLSAHGYAQLPGPDWGMDDLTIARFERDTQLQVPGEGSDRFAERARFLGSPGGRRTWLEWRAEQLHGLYGQIRDELVAKRRDVRLYLAGVEMFAGEELAQDLRPALPRRMTLADAMLQVGIDAHHYQDDPHVLLLQGEQVVPGERLGARAVDLELKQMSDADRHAAGLSTSGRLFYHPPQQVHVASFDQKSPIRPSYTWLATLATPSAAENRRRFVHALSTLDAQVIADGGWMLPMGQEDAIRQLVAAYRRLPAARFVRIGDVHGDPSAQPVTFRYAEHRGRTYLYVVNDAPFATMARLRVEAPDGCRLEELSGARTVAPLEPDGAGGANWEVQLEPYDLVAVRFSAAGVRLSHPQVSLSDAVQVALGERIRQLGARAAWLRSPTPLSVLENPGFEQVAAAAADPVPGWYTTKRVGIGVETDAAVKYGGNRSVKITSTGPIACLVSRPFEAPKTGRLYMLARLRVADAAQQPPLRMALRGKLHGQDYYRFASFGRAAAAAADAVPIDAHWALYGLRVDDLPLTGLERLQVRFDLMGAGGVWVDDVQVFDLAFEDLELKEFYRLISLAKVTLDNGQVGDCLRLLDGYWPRFLEEHVPLIASIARGPTATRKTAPAPQPPQRSGLLDRVKGMLPKPLRF